MSFSNVAVIVTLSKSTVFKLCRRKNVPFSCEREAYPSHFHRSQNVPHRVNVANGKDCLEDRVF